MPPEDLTDLTITLSRSSKSAEEELRLICRTATKLIPNASRVSLWKFSDCKDKIVCLMCLEKLKDEFSTGTELSKIDFPEYFSAILNHNVVRASDAWAHSATSCFNELYFKPNDIHSLLDYVYHKDFEPVGIICCESVGEQVEWTDEDVAHLRKISSLVSIFQT